LVRNHLGQQCRLDRSSRRPLLHFLQAEAYQPDVHDFIQFLASPTRGRSTKKRIHAVRVQNSEHRNFNCFQRIDRVRSDHYRHREGPRWGAFRGGVRPGSEWRTRIAIGVLSDRQRHYRVVNLPAGENRLQLRAVGLKADPQTGVTLTAEQNASCESTLQKGTVQWNELSMYRSQAISRSKGKGRTNRPLLCLPRFRVADGVGAPRRSGLARPGEPRGYRRRPLVCRMKSREDHELRSSNRKVPGIPITWSGSNSVRRCDR
jgi:hypothetical protein